MDELLGTRIDELLERIATPGRGPGGGSAAALSLAAAAALVVMVARRSRDSWDGAPGASAQALALRRRILPLIERDAADWHEALEALDARAERLEEKVARAAEVPLLIAELAADVATLAAVAAELGDGTYRGDAAAAAILAHGAAVAAENLVAINLTVRPGDPRFVRAQQAARAAQAAAERALAAGP